MAETEVSAVGLSTMGMGSIAIEGHGTVKSVNDKDASSANVVIDKI